MYDNIMFDLYGTLIDNCTHEDDIEVWRHMCGFYAEHGIKYNAAELRSRYNSLIEKQKRALLKKKFRIPEVQILDVFAELEARKRGKTEAGARRERAAADVARSGHDARSERVMQSGRDGQSEPVARSLHNEESLAEKAAWEFRRTATEYIRLYDGVTDMLARLKAAGVHLYILSNAQRAFTYPEICELGIEDYFDDISLSSDFGAMKPDAAFYQQILERNHLNPDRTLMVGNDCECDILAAARVRLHTCYVRSNLSPKEDAGRDIPADIMADAEDIRGLCHRLLG